MLIGFYGCKKSEIFSIIPEIDFQSYYLTLDPDLPTDTLIGIVFGYKDGDGDIGLDAKDTLPPFNSVLNKNNEELNIYHNNLIIEYLTQKEDGSFGVVIKPGSSDTLIYRARVENITPEGKFKAIRGTIDWRISPPKPAAYPGLSRTIKLRLRIFDRGLHQSNVIESPIIRLP